MKKLFIILFINIIFLNYINLKNTEKSKQIMKTKILACITLVKLKLEHDKDYFKYISKELEKKFELEFENEDENGFTYINNFFIFRCYKIMTEKQMFDLIIDVRKNKHSINLDNYNNIFEIKKLFNNDVSDDEIEIINDILYEIVNEKNQIEKLNNNDKKDKFKFFLKNIKKIQDQKKIKENKIKNFEKKNYTKKIKKININPEYNNTIWENVIINKILKDKHKIKLYEIIGLNSYLGLIISSLFLINIFNLKKIIKKTLNHNKKNIKIMKIILNEIIENKTN